MIEPNSLSTFKSKQVSTGPYSEKSHAELQLILRDASQYKDDKTIEAIKSEMATRNGEIQKTIVNQLEAVVEAKEPKANKPRKTKKATSTLP